MTDNQRIDGVIHVLQAVRAHPSMWVGENLLTINQFLQGFVLAASAAGLSTDYDKVRQQVQQERGWGNPASLIQFLQERGYDDERIADELIGLHIAVWQQIKQAHPQETS